MPTIHPRAIANYGLYLGAEATITLPNILGFAGLEGLNPDGFDTSDVCLLKPMAKAMTDVQPVLQRVNTLLSKKLYEAGDGFIDAAKHWDYVEVSNEQMFGGLNDHPAGQIILDDFADGVGRFKLSDPHLKSPPRNEKSVVGEFDGMLDGFILKALNWVWAQFPPHKSFEEVVIEPLLGNFYSIEANGHAWQKVGDAFGEMAGQMGRNAATLFAYGWYDSDDSHAAEKALEKFWTKGAAAAGEKLGGFLAQGFHDIAQVIPDVVHECIEGIKYIIKTLAEKLIAYADPFAGAITDVGRFIAKWLHIADTETIIDQIQDIIGIAKGIWHTYEGIRKTAEGITLYVKAISSLKEAVEAIPDIKSTVVQLAGATTPQQAADLGVTLASEMKQASDAVDGMSTKLDKAEKSLDEGKEKLDEAKDDFSSKHDIPDVSIDDVEKAIDKAKEAQKNSAHGNQGNGLMFGAGGLK